MEWYHYVGSVVLFGAGVIVGMWCKQREQDLTAFQMTRNIRDIPVEAESSPYTVPAKSRAVNLLADEIKNLREQTIELPTEVTSRQHGYLPVLKNRQPGSEGYSSFWGLNPGLTVIPEDHVGPSSTAKQSEPTFDSGFEPRTAPQPDTTPDRDSDTDTSCDTPSSK